MPPLRLTSAYAALFLIAALWGTFPVTGKLALRDFSPFVLATLRCVIASGFLVASLVRSGAAPVSPLTGDVLRTFCVLGLLGLVCSMLVSYLGVATTTAANATLLQAATPVMVALGAHVVLGERLRPLQWLGIAVSGLGVLLVVTDGRLTALTVRDLRLGDFLTLLSLTSWTGYTIYGKRVLERLSPEVATTGAYVCGTLMLIPFAVLTAPLFPAPRFTSVTAWMVVLYQAVTGAIAHVWWYKAVERIGASRSAIFQNLTPVVGVLLAITLLREPLDPWVVIGGAFVLAGVALTTSRRPRQTRS